MKRLQILGPGCPKCAKLAEAAAKAAHELGIDYQLDKVQEIDKIIAFGVMSTPALAVDGKVVVSGKVPSVEELKPLIEAYYHPNL